MQETDALVDLKLVTYRVFQRPETGLADKGRVVALTSASAGEGVTYVSLIVCRKLAGDKLGRTLYCTTNTLAEASLESEQNNEFNLTEGGFWTLRSYGEGARTAWDFNAAVRCARLERLRREFDYVIVDCPAVCGSGEVAGIASLTDSVLLVVAAGGSTKNQMEYAQQVINDSGGSLQGCILNRRTYPVPQLLHRILKAGAR